MPWISDMDIRMEGTRNSRKLKNNTRAGLYWAPDGRLCDPRPFLSSPSSKKKAYLDGSIILRLQLCILLPYPCGV